jgi:rare lipoprotein A
MLTKPGALFLAVIIAIGYMPASIDAQTPSTPPAAPAPAAPAPAAPPASTGGSLTGTVGETQTGLAAYYSQRLNGRRTASGERLNNAAMTTAHQTLPFGTKVKVTNVRNNKSVVLRVNDRGPTQPNRILDVTRAAAQRLGLIRSGLTEVKLEVVEAAKPRAAKAKKKK